MASLSNTATESRRAKSAADEAYLQGVGDRVRQVRDRLSMTRKGLSSASGVSERYLADLEAGLGNASLLVLRRVAAALTVDLESLVSASADNAVELSAIVAALSRLSPTELSETWRLVDEQLRRKASSGIGRLALIGLRGAGKSTLGQSAAQVLGVPFIELDREIERAAGMELSEIFALQGQTGYRQHQLRCLQALIEQHRDAVIATGGSLVTDPQAFEVLLQCCFVVWLKAEPQAHMDRVMAQGDLRPMADNPRAMDDLRTILDSRRSLYARAHASLDTTATTHEEALKALLEHVDRQRDAKRI